MKKSVTKTKHKEAHAPKTHLGMGEMMGSGKVNPPMKIKSGFGKTVSTKKLKVAPKNLA